MRSCRKQLDSATQRTVAGTTCICFNISEWEVNLTCLLIQFHVTFFLKYDVKVYSCFQEQYYPFSCLCLLDYQFSWRPLTPQGKNSPWIIWMFSLSVTRWARWKMLTLIFHGLFSNANFSSFFVFVHQVPWPVDIVISSECQKIYNQVFLLLLQIKWAKYSLDTLRFSGMCRISPLNIWFDRISLLPQLFSCQNISLKLLRGL